LNVDLDITSRVPLHGLVDAMGERVFVLYVGGAGRKHEAHVELASSHRDIPADRTIMGLVALVKKLPPRWRNVWDAARSREFNVGIEAGLEPHSYELRLDRRTIDAVAEVGGALEITVYAPDMGQGRAAVQPPGAGELTRGEKTVSPTLSPSGASNRRR
jgi:hypothetical protein